MPTQFNDQRPPTTVADRPTALPPMPPRGSRYGRWVVALATLVVLLLTGVGIERYDGLGFAGPTLRSTSTGLWPVQGQAAYRIDRNGDVLASADQQPAPIASVAKVMTAHLVLNRLPLRPGTNGPVLTITDADVVDTENRREQGQSVVALAAGEKLTERQALQALLLPSANNVAIILARRVAGSEKAFVALMNARATELGLTRTRYTDPSGFDDETVSTAADQVVLFSAAMRDPTFAQLVGTRDAVLPVVGEVHNTASVIGHDGIVGGKTGSHRAAGGCFAFAARRTLDGRRVTVIGVVMGQRHGRLIPAALDTSIKLLDSIDLTAHVR